MKNKKLFLTLSCLALLAGCGEVSSTTETSGSGTSVDTTSATGDSTSSEGSSSSGLLKAPLTIDDFIEDVASYNLTLEAEDYYIMNFYGGQAFTAAYVDSTGNYGDYSGVLDSGNGVWEFSFDSTGAVVLEQCVYKPTSYVGLDSIYSNYAYLSYLADEDVWDVDVDDDTESTYLSEDSNVLTAITALAGYSSFASYGYTPSSCTLTIDDDVVTIEGSFTYYTYNITIKLTFSDIGETSNSAIASFLASPTIPTVSDFDTTLKGYMTTYVNETLPYNTSLTAYANYGLNDNDGDDELCEYDGFMYEDLNSGDLVSAYATTLTNNGWTAYSTLQSSTYYSYQTFVKTITAPTSTTPGKYYYIELTYYTTSYYAYLDAYYAAYGYSTNYADLYSNGSFTISGKVYQEPFEATTVDNANGYLATITGSSGSQVIPNINFGSYTPTSFSLVNQAQDASDYYASSYGYHFGLYMTIDGTFAASDTATADANATSAVSSWISALTAAGYRYYASGNTGTYSTAAAAWAAEGTVALYTYDSSFADCMYGGYVFVQIDLGTYDSNSGAYVTGSGTFSVFIYA